MKLLIKNSTIIGLLILLLAGCEKADNFLVREAALTVSLSGYNGSRNGLDVLVDTFKLGYPIAADAAFKQSAKYSFREGQEHVQLMVKEQLTGKLIYERQVKAGEYTVRVDLIYVNGKVVEKPALPAKTEGAKQISYLFIPKATNYDKDIDIAYYKKWEYVANGQLVFDKEEQLTKVSTKPYEFSPFLDAPVFQGGRTEINGLIYFVNPELKIFRSGTTIRYYEETGFSVGQYAYLPIPMDNNPTVVLLIENGQEADQLITGYYQVKL